jgi:hypothetical protein
VQTPKLELATKIIDNKNNTSTPKHSGNKGTTQLMKDFQMMPSFGLQFQKRSDN